jgi:hypothetical protein
MHFQKITAAPWIHSAQAVLSFELPPCFLELMCSYSFSEFRIHQFHHYDNYAGNEYWCWPAALVGDAAILEIYNRHRFLPIGQPEEGNYDRICLDLSRLKRGDCPLVQLDHEAMLLKDKIEIIAELAPSYRTLVAKVLEAYWQIA